jgi:hypothetical protein
MATMISPNITTLLQARSRWRGTVQLSPQSQAKIDTIRAEIQSGENDAGWNKVGGWSSGSRFGGGGGGGGGRFSGASAAASQSTDYKRFMTKRPQAAPASAASAPIRFNRAAPSASTPVAAPAYTRYVSRFKNATDTVENVVVNTIIQGKLNKFSIANYEEVREFLMEILGAGERDFLSDFMRLIFQKAATEPTFCPLYAKLLAELSSRFPFLRSEMDSLYKSFLDIFQEVSDVGTEDMAAFIKKNTEKKYRLGYSQFIAELFKYDIISTDDIMSTITTITNQMMLIATSATSTATMEQYADCLLRMLRILAADSTAVAKLRPAMLASCDSKIQTLTVKSEHLPGLNNKVRFAMMDARKVIVG